MKRPEGWVGAGMKAGWCQVIEQNQDAFWRQNQQDFLVTQRREGEKRKGWVLVPLVPKPAPPSNPLGPKMGLHSSLVSQAHLTRHH